MPRVKGQDKSIDKARKYLRSLDDVKDLLSDHFIEAYNVIYAVMTDEKAPAASRRAAARDIITMYFDQYQDSKDKVEEFFNQLEGESDEPEERIVQPAEKEDDEYSQDTVVPIFKFKE